MSVTIGALRESVPAEKRVSLVPETAEKFVQTQARVLLEYGAGAAAQFPDASYRKVEWGYGRVRPGRSETCYLWCSLPPWR